MLSGLSKAGGIGLLGALIGSGVTIAVTWGADRHRLERAELDIIENRNEFRALNAGLRADFEAHLRRAETITDSFLSIRVQVEEMQKNQAEMKALLYQYVQRAERWRKEP